MITYNLAYALVPLGLFVLQGLVDLDAEIIKCDKKLDVARMAADKLRKTQAQPEYESTVPENVRTTNEEKVRLYCCHTPY